jgi:hypothetical protein
LQALAVLLRLTSPGDSDHTLFQIVDANAKHDQNAGFVSPSVTQPGVNR